MNKDEKEQVIKDEKEAEKVFQQEKRSSFVSPVVAPVLDETVLHLSTTFDVMTRIAQVLRESGADSRSQEVALQKIKVILGLDK